MGLISYLINNLNEFYEYIGKGSATKDNDIVPFVLNTFHRLRNLIGEQGGEVPLKAFLYLLAASDDENVNLEKWGLNEKALEVVSALDSHYWEQLKKQFKDGVKNNGLVPNITLILRHCAGRLFEEAHFAAFVDAQMTLFGPSDRLIRSRVPQQYGAYFTPSFIARSIVEEILLSYEVLPDKITVFDPACGSSEFLVEFLRQLKNKSYPGSVKVIGWDISESAVDMSRFILKFETREWGNNVDVELHQKDSLDSNNIWPKIDILLMNPPFQSWELMKFDSQLRDKVKTILGDKYVKNPNLSAAFLWLAVEALKDNGKIGCLIPSAILNSDSHLGLRKVVAGKMKPSIVGRLGSFVFENALVDACMLVANHSEENLNTKILWTKNISGVTSKALRELRKLHFSPMQLIDSKDQFSIYEIKQDYSIVDNWMPVSYQSSTLKEKVEVLVQLEVLTRVKNVFSVHRGVDPGRKYFRVKESYYNTFKKNEKEYFRPCADSGSIKNGVLKLVDYIFYPNTVGLKPLKTDDDLMKFVPTFYNEVLLPNKEDLQSRVLNNEALWWQLQRHRPWQEGKSPKLVSGAFGKAGDFAFDITGNYVVEQGCAWIAKDEFMRPELNYAYLSFFCSNFWNNLLSIYSKQLAVGEWFNLQTKHVNEIPIPNFSSHEDLDTISKLIDIGQSISLGKPFEANLLSELIKKLIKLN